jgi:predicted transcriptional regulator
MLDNISEIAKEIGWPWAIVLVAVFALDKLGLLRIKIGGEGSDTAKRVTSLEENMNDLKTRVKVIEEVRKTEARYEDRK